jgi:drug/metabolite transporter (DMT)-like permease
MGQGFQLGGSTFRGDVLCFITMLIFCGYISVGRLAGQGRSLWVYVVPLYAMAGAICLITAVVVRVPFPVLSRAEVLRWIGLGLIPTVIGHSIYNHSIKHLRGQTLSTLNLSQFIFAGVMAFFIFNEVPPLRMYVVAAVIAVGVVIVIRANPEPPPAEPE